MRAKNLSRGLPDSASSPGLPANDVCERPEKTAEPSERVAGDQSQCPDPVAARPVSRATTRGTTEMATGDGESNRPTISGIAEPSCNHRSNRARCSPIGEQPGSTMTDSGLLRLWYVPLQLVGCYITRPCGWVLRVGRSGRHWRV